MGALWCEVKPPNILADRKMKKVKLADFGISKILEASGHAGASRGGGLWQKGGGWFGMVATHPKS